MQICDLHNHILPGMDDGCSDVRESVTALLAAREQGVNHLFLTPHYYAPEPVEEFLQRRSTALEQLKPQLPEGIHLCLGAEVAYFSGISRCEALEQLCLGSSRYLLLEMPFTAWDSNVFRELKNLIYIRGIRPILAHVERYLRFQRRPALKLIQDMDVLVQMNAGFLLGKITGMEARRLLRKGVVHVLGSDCHNNEERSFHLGLAAENLKRHKMTAQLQQAAALSMEIFQRAMSEQ